MDKKIIGNLNQNQDSNNEEVKNNIISKEYNLNKDINNQELINHNQKISKESPDILNNKEKPKIREISIKESLKNEKKYAKVLKTKKIQKKKKSIINPFLTENNKLRKNSKKSKNTKMTHKSRKTSYFENYKNDNKADFSENINNSNVNKTVFSKISENMYKNTKEVKFPDKKPHNLMVEGEENYNKFIEEAFLCSCANSTNKENKIIINEFLERKKNEEISKKIGIDSEKEKENDLVKLQDLKRSTVLTDRNRRVISTRTFNEFLQDQKNKEEKHQDHLKTNINLKAEEINSKIKDRPTLNEESIKLAKNSNRNAQTKIHFRLYEEFNDKKKRDEEKMKEKKKMYDKVEKKTLSKDKIKENVERLFHEYEARKKRIDENESKKKYDVRNLSSNRSTSKNSNEIIFKRFKKNLENSLNNIINKKIDEDFEINYTDFVKLLYQLNFISKNYYELMENKDKKNKDEDDNEEEKIKLNEENKAKRVIFKKEKNFELDREYKLINDAWKIITKSKEFKTDILASSKRIYLFLFSTLGIYNGDIDENFIKKEFYFIKDSKMDGNISASNSSNLSKQIYKYFYLYRNNAINGLLFRDREDRRRLDIETQCENNIRFTPNLKKSSTFSKNYFSPETHLSVEKNYDQYIKNKKLKIKQREKELEKIEKEKCPFIPNCYNAKEKKNMIEISKRLHKTGLKHLKNCSSTPNNFDFELKKKKNIIDEKSFDRKNKSIKKMFNNNPLENDSRVQQKINELKESREQRSFEKFILKKGFRPKEDYKNSNLYEFNEINFKNGRFALDDEPLNTFKNTFEKYEKFDKKMANREKYIFEIIVDNKPKSLIIYADDDINYKVKVFCNVYKLNYSDKKRILQTIYQQLKGNDNFYF